MLVVLDAGHGGHDPGATTNNYQEKDLALQLTLKVRDLLVNQGVKVKLTRDKDEFIELRERSNISNNANATIFVSFHLNSFSKQSAQGLEVFHYPNSKNGLELARSVYSQLAKDNLYTKQRGVKSASFSVLRHTQAPSILIETVFISNDEDVKLLIDSMDKFAISICKGIMAYLKLDYKEVVQMDKEQDKVPTWAEKEWEKGIELGITVGGNPNRAATRAEVNSMIIRALNLLEGR